MKKTFNINIDKLVVSKDTLDFFTEKNEIDPVLEALKCAVESVGITECEKSRKEMIKVLYQSGAKLFYGVGEFPISAEVPFVIAEAVPELQFKTIKRSEWIEASKSK